VTANLISADRHFLQQLLLEREELLQQVAQVVEEVDDKQRYEAPQHITHTDNPIYHILARRTLGP
jgi:hypothetical protein